MPELTDNNDLRSRIIAEAKSRIPVPMGEDEVTSSMLAEELGCNTRTAYYILEGMVDEGKATVRKNGSRGRKVYRSI